MWSCSRLDFLADQALAAFLHNLHRTDLVRHSRKRKLALKDLIEVQKQLESHPMLFIHSVSELLYEQHGYSRMAHNGDPDSYLISAVMERGAGSPIILSIIFREVCRRAGLQTGITVLDGGTYCMLWPLNAKGEYGHSGMMLKGEHLLVDAYTGGSFILEKEVKELFDVDSMVPSTDRDILYAVLAGLRDCNWARALNRMPVHSRTSMVQCLQHAIDPNAEVEDDFALSRAIAAAERALQVKPSFCELYLDAAILYALEGDYTTSWHHFEMVYACIQPWTEKLGDDSAADMLARASARAWSDSARYKYFELEGVDPCAEETSGSDQAHDDGEWNSCDSGDDEQPHLLSRPEWPPSDPGGGLGGGPSVAVRSGGSGWTVQQISGAELSQETHAGEMQLAARGVSWPQRLVPAGGWRKPPLLLERPVWGGLGVSISRQRSESVEAAEAAAACPPAVPPHGTGTGGDALGAHHIACSGSSEPPYEEGSEALWKCLDDSADERLDAQPLGAEGSSAWIQEEIACTTRAPLALDSTIFDSTVIAQLLLLRHKVGLLMREQPEQLE